MTEEEYLSATCVSCRNDGRIHTNLECIQEIAATTGTPLDQAIREFRPPTLNRPPFAPAPTETTNWSPYVARYKYENGEPE